ncbi:MAG TPA: hypothetical protein VGL81_09135 [Polyangiaceae bacterium]|jgi:hypothetical protein
MAGTTIGTSTGSVSVRRKGDEIVLTVRGGDVVAAQRLTLADAMELVAEVQRLIEAPTPEAPVDHGAQSAVDVPDARTSRLLDEVAKMRKAGDSS